MKEAAGKEDTSATGLLRAERCRRNDRGVKRNKKGHRKRQSSGLEECAS
jgi:hypothetical protein